MSIVIAGLTYVIDAIADVSLGRLVEALFSKRRVGVKTNAIKHATDFESDAFQE